jgi:hypothetical protein
VCDLESIGVSSILRLTRYCSLGEDVSHRFELGKR